MKEQPCGCCEGTEILTPQTTANRPGLEALSYRAGTHGTFLETMMARLSSADYPELAGLTTRDGGDPAIALLDAWATVADVLTFYQERIANEGYLPTASERRSILELARLVGYSLRPGVAATAHLAFEMEKDTAVDIPAGTRAQSLPGPGELPQPFETDEPLPARTEWNALKPRPTRPQQIVAADSLTLYLEGTATNLKPLDPILVGQAVYRVQKVELEALVERTQATLGLWQAPLVIPGAGFAGGAMPASLHATPLRTLISALAEVGGLSEEELRELVVKLAQALLATFAALAQMQASPLKDQAVEETVDALQNLQAAVDKASEGVTATSVLGRALARLGEWNQQALHTLGAGTIPPSGGQLLTGLGTIVSGLLRPVPTAALPPKSALYLPRDVKASFALKSDAGPRLLLAMQPALKPLLYAAWRNTGTPKAGPAEVYALRASASLFGHSVPLRPVYDDQGRVVDQLEWTPALDENGSTVFLDGAYDRLLPGSPIAILKPGAHEPEVYQVADVAIRSRTAYGISAKTTELTLVEGQSWWAPNYDSTDDLAILRGAVVYMQADLLGLAEAPVFEDIGPHPEDAERGRRIELDGLYDGLQPGRWLIVAGERTDLKDQFGETIPGVHDAELVMLANVEQTYNENLPGDTTHTTLVLANSLAYSYKRDTVNVYGNVVKASHGETRQEVLGSGDGSQARQRFTLKQKPVTHLAAPTPAGAESTLEVRVDDVLWHEAEHLFTLEPGDRAFVTLTDDEDQTTVLFGDGKRGARPPSGVENIRATYRTGIGKPGNVAAEQISLLATRPLGVKGVINPLPATGGADREDRDQARRNAPLTTLALDRLVSVQDYADFCRTFAGIGKAHAVRLPDGRRQLVHVTIAGADDAPINEHSDLYHNLLEALRRHGDPHQPVQVALRELKTLVVSAGVHLLPDYEWASVEPKVRAALLDTFSFARRNLGQDVLYAEVVSAIQAVPGVAYVDLDTLDAVDEERLRIFLETGIDPEASGKPAGRTLLSTPPLADHLDLKLKTRIRCRLAGPDPSGSGEIRPAQVAYLNPDVPDTLVLEERGA